LSTHHADYTYYDESLKDEIENVDELAFNHFNYTLRPSLNKAGTEIVVHDPYEVVPSSENHFTLGRADLLFLSITPVISKTDDSLLDKDPDL
jgi:hypothetical protein